MKVKLTLYEQFLLIHSTHLPSITIGVDVTIEPLEEDKKLAGRYVLLAIVKGYGVLDPVHSQNCNELDCHPNIYFNF